MRLKYYGKTFIIILLIWATGLFTACRQALPLQSLDGDWQAADSQSNPRVWTSLSLPGEYTHSQGTVIPLRHYFFLDRLPAADEEIWLDLVRPDFPLELYLNGTLLLRRGDPPGSSTFINNAANNLVLLPRELLRAGNDANELALTVYTQTGRVRFHGVPRLIGREAARYKQGVELFLNTSLFLMFGAVSLVGGLYFLALWLGYRQRMERLYFALAAVCMSLYFVDFGSPQPLLTSAWYFPVMKSSLLLAFGFLMCFFLEFFGVHNRPALRWLFLLGFLACAVFVATSSGDHLATLDRFTITLIPLQLAIVFAVYLLIRALLGGNPEAPVVLAGIVVGVGFGTHDVVCQVLGIIPVVWLQGLGFFFLLGSMFLSLAVHSNRLYRTLKEFSDELVAQREELVSTNQAFARFVPAEFLDFLGKRSILDMKLGDQVQRQMTILFSDIRNFTSLSEKITPKENFALINSFLNHMAPVVRQHGGIIDKYIGDSIMALYPESPARAIESALAMRSLLKQYNAGRQQAGYQALDTGVGIHTGLLMLGIIGEEHRMESTVISDAVNTASRLENLTKLFGVSIIVSQAALEADPGCRQNFELRYLGAIPLKGRSQGLGVYEVLHAEDPAYQKKLAYRELFHQCIRSWESRGSSSQNSAEIFADYTAHFPEDSALAFYLKREAFFNQFADNALLKF